MARQATSVDSAGLHGARTFASERLSSVSNVRIGASKGEMTISISAKDGRITSSHVRGGGDAGKNKALHKK
jgi:hypothetical protein